MNGSSGYDVVDLALHAARITDQSIDELIVVTGLVLTGNPATVDTWKVREILRELSVLRIMVSAPVTHPDHSALRKFKRVCRQVANLVVDLPTDNQENPLIVALLERMAREG